MKNIFWFGILVLGIYFFVQLMFAKISLVTATRVTINYSEKIEKIAAEKDLPAHYFKALAALECSGEKPPKTRFEEHIYEKLTDLQSGRIKKFGQLTTKKVAKLSTQELRQLATSWGVFQIMGYHAFADGKSIDALKNDLAYCMTWCDKTYGYYLLKNDFKNAFHLHNTGKLHPKWGLSKTHDPFYVQKGIAYMNEFSK